MNKTFYVRDQDAAVYDDARLLAGNSQGLGRLILSLLREWIHKNDPTGKRRAALRSNTVAIGGRDE